MFKFFDRLVQFPNRFRLNDLGGGLVELTPDQGNVQQEGTLLDAKNLNLNNKEIHDSIKSINDTLIKGEGSEVDADMLDGKHGKDYVLKEDCIEIVYDEYPQKQIVKKYSNGKMILEQTYAALTDISGSWGTSGLKTKDLEPHPFKVAFKNPPVLKHISPSYSSNNYVFMVGARGVPTTTKGAMIMLCRGDTAPLQEFRVEMVFEGVWK